MNGLSPPQSNDKFQYISGGSREGEICNLYTKKSKTHKQFDYLGAKCWNILPQLLQQADSDKYFSKKLKNYMFNAMKNDTAYMVDNYTVDKFYKISSKFLEL